jgi:enterochelin esterase-like enzyme
MRFKLFIGLILVSQLTFGQTFDQFLTRINTAPVAQKQAIADSFMNAVTAKPYIEQDTIAHFVYNSQAQSVSLAGDVSGWSPDSVLTNVSGSNFWYCTDYYPNDARLDYKFVINASNWILDPNNPNTCTGGFGPNSELRMPGSIKPPEITFSNSIAHGVIIDTICQSSALGNSRKVKIYLPAGYPSGMTAYPVVLFHDGLEYVSLGNAKNILDYLIANQMMAPVIALFVPPVDRSPEYSGNRKDLFTSFIVNELIPTIDAKFKTSRDPSRRAMIGASDGGNISLYIAMKHPEVFAKTGAQSSNVIPAISTTLASGPKLDLTFYLDIGTYDIPVLMPKVYNLKLILENKGYVNQFQEWHEGHSWGNWMEHLRYPLTMFFPVSLGSGNSNEPPAYKLGPVIPNPFYGQTTINFSAPIGSGIELSLYDLTGKKIKSIFSGPKKVNENSILYEHKTKGGEYVITMESQGKVVDSLMIFAL